jgi:hypothetical protein
MKQVFGEPDTPGQTIQRGDHNRANFTPLAITDKALKLFSFFGYAALSSVRINPVDHEVLGFRKSHGIPYLNVDPQAVPLLFQR